MLILRYLSLLAVLNGAHVYGTNYEIKVTTSQEPFAGTDARVYVNLIGVNGASTGSIKLHNSMQDFERGRTDTFYRDASPVGHLKAIKVHRDNSGFGPNWKLARITVRFSGSPLYKFYFNKWIPAYRWTTANEENECRAGLALCQHLCIDTGSGYNCACRTGFKLEGRYKCTDVDECSTGEQKCHSQTTRCKNNLGGYTCPCKRGYQPGQSAYECQDINECMAGNHKCEGKTTNCKNNFGSYSCECKDGFELGLSPYKCNDINECIAGNHKCEEKTTSCKNNFGSYTCKCKGGYEPEPSLYKCNAKRCNISIPLGMENGHISNQSITASSYYSRYPPWLARLKSGAEESWYALPSDANPWIQVDLDKLTWLRGVATQGKRFSLFVKTYKLAYSLDGIHWSTYKKANGQKEMVFKGNTDPYKVAKVELDNLFFTRYVRLYPKTWRDGIALKMELYGCRPA